MFVGGFELRLDIISLSEINDTGFIFDLLHGLFPKSVNILEHLGLISEGLSNIIRSKHRLELHPDLLAFAKFFYQLTHAVKLCFPAFCLWFQSSSHVGRAQHCLDSDHLVIKLGIHFIVGFKNESILVLESGHLEILHLCLQYLELLSELELLFSTISNVLNIW